MNLKDFLGVGAPELYWALVLEPGWVEAAIWNVQGEKAQVATTSPVTAWETDDELISATDTALSAAIQNLPEDAKEPTKCVFGVPPSWVNEGQIKEEYLNKIKKICSELSLTPSGFVVLSEAVSNLLKSEEEAPLSAIVLEISTQNLEVTVFRLGNLVGTTNVARSVSIFDDVVEGLTRFVSTEPLPSRIILYNGKGGELETLKQELLKSDWEAGKINFLHTPKVEVLDAQKKIIAVCLAGAAELGNATEVVTTNPSEETEMALGEKFDLGEKTEDLKEEEPAKNEEKIEENLQKTDEVSADDLGFVIGGDVKSETQVHHEKPKSNPLIIKSSPVSGILQKLKNTGRGLTGIFNKVPRGVKPVSLGPNHKLIIGIAVLFGLFGLYLFWLLYPKATITIYVAPKTVQNGFDVTIDPNSSSNDPGSGKLAGQSVSADESGSKSSQVTGTKTVGDSAHGTVKIENGTANIVNLPAATKITSSGGFVFTLDNSASISAALSPGNPGTAQANVTAVDIGSSYNVSQDESFKIANYPKADMDAIATTQFSGGSSREVPAVSANDQKNLKDALEQDLSASAGNDLAGKVNDSQYLITSSLSLKDTSADFDHKVGDQASNLNLNLKVSAVALVVDKNALFQIASDKMKNMLDSGYALNASQLSYSFSPLASQDKTLQYHVDAVANLLPQVNVDQVASQIQGKSVGKATLLMQNIPGFKTATINFNFSMPGIFKVIPNLKKNISISIAGQK